MSIKPLNSPQSSENPGPMSYEEFLDWADEDTLAEWVDGEIVMTSPASFRHQQILGFLHRVIVDFTEMSGLGQVLLPPFQMKIVRGREPDLLFVQQSRLNLIKKSYLDGPADLVVEIISPESANRDRQDKFNEYAEGGVVEYWLIDPIQSQAQFYRLGEHGTYMEIAPDSDGKVPSAVLTNFWLRPQWLWQQPLPEPADILLEIAGEAYLQRLLAKAKKQGIPLPPQD